MQNVPESSDYAAWRDRLAQAAEPAFWPIEVMDEMLADGRASFFGTDKGALVIRTVKYPGGAYVAEALAGAGEKHELTQIITNAVSRWGEKNGLTHLIAPGRLGWSRALKGWTAMQVVMQKGVP